MRLFRYLDTTGALLTIEKRALRVSRLHDLNDPFEWRLGITNLRNGVEHLAEAATEAGLRDLSSVFGVICFSAVPDQSVLWSHYADRHRGMVLELEVPDDPKRTVRINYTDERPHIEAARIGDTAYIKEQLDRACRQKSTGWTYEQEYRVYVLLAECEARGGFYYSALQPGALKRVIIGCRSTCDLPYVERALSSAGYSDTIAVRASMQNESYRIKC